MGCWNGGIIGKIFPRRRDGQGPLRRLWRDPWPAVNALIFVAALAVVFDLLPSGWRVGSKPSFEVPTATTPPTKLPGVIRFRASQTIVGIASVLDGDTIEIHGQRIRLWGIDAPEGDQVCWLDGKVWQCGRQSAFALSYYIAQQTVSCEQRDTDRYGRVVAVCGINQTPDLGEWLVRKGWALDWPHYSHGAYAYVQGQAKFDHSGMWRGEFDKPWEWRQGPQTRLR